MTLRSLYADSSGFGATSSRPLWVLQLRSLLSQSACVPLCGHSRGLAGLGKHRGRRDVWLPARSSFASAGCSQQSSGVESSFRLHGNEQTLQLWLWQELEGGCDFSQSDPNPGRAQSPDQPAKYQSQVDERIEEIAFEKNDTRKQSCWRKRTCSVHAFREFVHLQNNTFLIIYSLLWVNPRC